MRKKAVWIIPSILVMVLLALLVGLPASAAPSGVERGTLNFLNEGNDAIAWSNAGDIIRLEVKDEDLDTPVKRVLIPTVDTGQALSGSVETDGTTTLTGTDTDFQADLDVGDTILVTGHSNDAHYETVRMVITIDETNQELTVATPFSLSEASLDIYKVTNDKAYSDKCPRCTAGYSVTGSSESIDDLLSLVDTNVGAGIANRFTGAPDTILNRQDVLVTQADGTPITGYRVDTSNGELTQISGGSFALYWAGSVNTAEVTVTSQADTKGITVTLTETGATTGAFRADVALSTADSDAAADPPVLKVAGTGSDVVTMKYSDASPSSTVSRGLNIENTPPSFSNIAPAHGTATTQSLPTVSGTVTDTASGVNKDTIRVKFSVGELPIVTTLDPASSIGDIIESSTGVFDVSQRNPTIATDANVLWWLIAHDAAGNMGVSDQVAPTSLTGTVATAGSITVTGTGTKFTEELAAGDTITVAGETRVVEDPTTDTTLEVTKVFTHSLAGQVATKSVCNPDAFNDIDAPTATANGGCDPFIVKVDNTAPVLNSATTGVWWDASKTGADKSEEDPSKARKNSIRAEFNDGLDATTVQASDFRVAGAPPLNAETFGIYVFLTVPEQAPNAEPKVELVGEVKDQAGNARSSDTTTADDRIAPTLDIAITGTASEGPAATKDKVTILVVTDEDTNTPTVTVYKVGGITTQDTETPPNDIPMGGNTLQGQGTALTPAPTGTARNWSVDYSPTAAGLYSVYVSVQDLRGSAGKAGTTNDTDAGTGGTQIDLANAILFEKDTGIPAPTFIPATGGSTDNPNTFITVDFADEGKEYGLTASDVEDGKEAGKQQTATPADVATSYDHHATLTLVSATVDDVDVTSLVNTRDGVKFAVRPGGLAAGDHTIAVKVSDEAGNEGTFSSTFTVVGRGTYKVPIDPGFNLISIPATPTVSDINEVIGATSPISFVMTYDNASGLFLVASRDEDPESPTHGQLVGNLTNIDSQHAYWVNSDQFVDLEVTLPRLEGGRATFLTTIQVFAGWNLVPVVDSNQRAVGTTIPVEDYFSNLGGTWTAYEFNTQSATFTKITEDTEDGQVVLGRGYFVYVSTDGVIIP